MPLLVDEPATKNVMKLYKEDSQIVAWWGTTVECASALARLERDGNLAGSAVVQSFERLKVLTSSWQEVQPVDALRELAVRLIRVQNLRSGDSQQLAAALLASEHRPGSLELVCLDARLAQAAQREGFRVLGLD